MYLTPLQSTVESLWNNLLSWPEVLGLVPLAIAAWMVFERTQSSADPSSSLALRSDTGSLSLNVSGAYLVAVVTLAAVYLLRNVLLEVPLLLAVPVGLVAWAWWLEKQEAMG